MKNTKYILSIIATKSVKDLLSSAKQNNNDKCGANINIIKPIETDNINPNFKEYKNIFLTFLYKPAQ